VHDFDSWIDCLNRTKTSVDSGFCLSPEFVQHHDETKPGKYEIMIVIYHSIFTNSKINNYFSALCR